ncbi:putative DNA-directed RNA polymerase II subunit RPB7 [Triangularia setosa]|uniref:DNA-directed RNA polymerase subunit n=1 Tax=Triangularia setosa TaxID=2587417 RepID=A0AAN7AA18_9PEZI|nr:putative DNA-directed RNA polymerase II subunit RPB7 [Podospora setosa]
MFFLHNLERRVLLHPSYFGKNMTELVTTKLVKDVEGTCTGDYYIIAIMDTFDLSEGRILPGSGMAEFTVGYRAVVWRPFKGEVVDTICTSVNQHGFFANAGPLSIFVSSHLIPDEITYDANATPPQYTNHSDIVIEPGTHVRIKIIGLRTGVGEMFAIGKIDGDYLGFDIFYCRNPTKVAEDGKHPKNDRAALATRNMALIMTRISSWASDIGCWSVKLHRRAYRHTNITKLATNEASLGKTSRLGLDFFEYRRGSIALGRQSTKTEKSPTPKGR